MNIANLTYRPLLLQNAPKIHTDLLWDLTWLFLILAVVYFGAVFYYRNRKSYKSKKVGLRKAELSPIVSEFLFYDENATNDEKSKYIQLKVEIRQLIKDDFNRRVLSEVLLDLRKDVSGDTQKRLFKLYEDLGLQKDAYKKLKSWKWQVVSKGILELTQMQVEESYGLIAKFINDKRGTIRKQAEVATVTLKNDGIDYFLDNTRFKISEWQQLKLLDVIRNFEDYQPPRFKIWLTSSNRNVVLFALRLIKYYNQNDASTSLLELVKHKNNRIKSEAINCIKEFNVVEASETLKAIFWKSTADIKIQILDVLATFGQENDLVFLNLIEKKESNFAVKSKALSAINTIRPESILPTDGILDISGYQVPEDIVVKSKTTKEIDYEDALCEVPLMQPEISIEEAIETTKINKVEEVPVDEAGQSSSETNKNENVKNNETEVGHMNPENNKDEQLDIRQFDVIFIEVSKNSADETIEKTMVEVKPDDFIDEDLIDIDLSFLPHVVPLESQVDPMPATILEKYGPSESSPISDVLAIEVCYDEVKPGSFEKIEDLVSTNDLTNQVEQRIGDQSIKEIKDEKYQPSPTKGNNEVENIEVEFEELNSLPEETIKAPYAIDKTELDFLPIVVDEVEDIGEIEFDTSKYTPTNEKKEYSKLQIFDCEVEYLEVMPALDEIDFELPPQDKTQIADQPLSLNEIDLTDLSEIEVLFEEVCVEGRKADILKEIPKIEFYSEETLQTMSLLDDIDELGDSREIPLLLEYLAEAKNIDVRNRIREIIKKFARWESKPKAAKSEMKTNKLPLVYNVLEELFGSIDFEEKLILLDAVSDIVDEEDLSFLMKIKDHPKQELRDKATIMIMELEKRLSQKPKEESIAVDLTDDEPNASDIFNVDFEIALPRENESVSEIEVEAPRKESSFLDQLLTLPNKIIQSLNG